MSAAAKPLPDEITDALRHGEVCATREFLAKHMDKLWDGLAPGLSAGVFTEAMVDAVIGVSLGRLRRAMANKSEYPEVIEALAEHISELLVASIDLHEEWLRGNR